MNLQPSETEALESAALLMKHPRKRKTLSPKGPELYSQPAAPGGRAIDNFRPCAGRRHAGGHWSTCVATAVGRPPAPQLNRE
jgi:hypothetical protein